MVSLAATLPQQVRAVYPWTGAYLDVDGGRMHYLDEGPRDAPVMLCVHGNPTWSFYWRAIVAHFSQRYRVIVPDHVGCGLSDKPQSWDYRLAQHVENLQRLVDHLSLEDITLVVHDWGGAIGMGVATVPGFGALAVRGGNAFARAATFRAVSLPLAPAAKAGLLFPYGSWADRIATLRFVQDIPMAEKHPSYATLSAIDAGLAKLKDHPMLLCWGDDDFCFTPAFRAEWERRFPAAQSLHWTGVGHYVMEDAPDKVLAAMDTFLDPENAS
jgi:pimeloyl-ACP methyl ester carboxylesterase